MIKLLRKLIYGQAATPIVDMKPKKPKPFKCFPHDDFGQRWQETMQLDGFADPLAQERLITFLMRFRNASVANRSYELRRNGPLSYSDLHRLSAQWSSLITHNPWVQVPTNQFAHYRQTLQQEPYLLASCNWPLAHAILVLYLHLHQRDAMKDLMFFIAACDRTVLGLGKAAPDLERAAIRLRRSYRYFPRFKTDRDQEEGRRLKASTFDELARLIGDEVDDE